MTRKGYHRTRRNHASNKYGGGRRVTWKHLRDPSLGHKPKDTQRVPNRGTPDLFVVGMIHQKATISRGGQREGDRGRCDLLSSTSQCFWPQTEDRTGKI